MISDIVLDHVAIAVERPAQAFRRYITELGARWLWGGLGPEGTLGVRLLVCPPSPSAWFPAADQGNN